MNWTRFLIFGISIFYISACKTIKDYQVNYKWTYVNETEHFISYSDGPWGILCNLSPKDSVTILTSSKGDKNVNPKRITAFLRPDIIYYNNILCDTQRLRTDPGPGNINDYTIKTIKNNDFEYRYVFTKAFAERADTCR